MALNFLNNGYFAGNVGIGTISPDELLDVEGSINNNDIAIRIINTFDDNNAASEPNAALFLSATSNNAYLRCHGAPANTAAKHQIDLGSTAGSSFLTFSPNGSEKMRISSAGAVKFNAYNLTNNIGTATYLLGTDAAGNVVKTSAVPSANFNQGAKTHSVGTAFSNVLTVALSSHQGCYVTLCCFGDWGGHSSAAYRGEFFLQNGAGAYNEPGIIIRQDDNTSDGTDQIICQILDPGGSTGSRNFIIQIRHTDTTSPTTFTGTITFTVQGQFNSVT